MRAAGEDGKGEGADLALSEADLAKLLDRTHVFADDLASGADAGGFLDSAWVVWWWRRGGSVGGRTHGRACGWGVPGCNLVVDCRCRLSLVHTEAEH
jgi:hypothetical protein